MTLNIPGYKIIKTLGKGGMATVYLAVQEIFEREVALKIMAKGLSDDPSFGQRFMREAQIVSKLAHPNIITVYDVGVHDGAYYLSMEYIRGCDLKHARTELNFQQKITVIKQIASALDVSGAKGYVHRDIKPENIMVESASNRAVLMDFGIARASEVDISVTQAGTAIGTPHYMSPEQAKGLEVDSRADLYSLGVVLFYMLAGYVPFEGDSAIAIGIRHITEAVPELPAHLRDLQWLLDKAMAKSPEDRFQSGAEFIAALDSMDLDYLAAQADAWPPSAQELPLDSPTIVSNVPIHRYGDSSRKLNSPESFTLTFNTEQPAELNMRWPLYVAIALVTALTVGGLYLVATYTPEPIKAPATSAKDLSAQHSLGNLILGKNQKLSADEQAQATTLVDAIAISQQRLNANNDKRFNEAELTKVVSLYQQLLTITPRDADIVRQLNNVADQQIARLEPTFNAGNFKEAQRILASVLHLFPKYETNALKQARSKMTHRSQIESLLDQAKQSFRNGHYLEPANANAVNYYKAALRLTPELEPAKAGLAEIAQLYVSKTQKALRNADPAEARLAIHQALTALPSYGPALELENQILSSASLEEKISTLMDQAQRHQNNHRYFSPKQQNAFEAYTAILALDRRNSKALTQQESLAGKLQASLTSLINKGNPDEALARLNAALASQPNLSVLRQLEKKTHADINDYQFNHLPRIDTVRASGLGRIDLSKDQPRAIAIKDKIFVKFDYFNLSKGKVLIEAVLYEHTNGSALATKPLFISGPSGDNEFVFDLDRAGLKAGTYRIALLLSGDKLAELVFKVT